MIKKLGLFAFVLVLAIAFAMPALAFTIDGAKGEKMYIGGSILNDFGYWSRSKELIAGVPGYNKNDVSDRTEFYQNLLLHSTLRGTIEVGNVGMMWEFGMGGDRNPSELLAGAVAGGAGASAYVETRQLYGFYNFGNCQILAGKTHGQLYSVIPWQTMGVWQGHVYGFGWGSIYDGRTAQVRFTQNVTKQVGWMISLVEPGQYVDPNPNLSTNAKNNNSYAYYPQVDAKVMMNFGIVALYPAFGYQYVKWDNVQNGFDDNVQSWYGVLPVVVKVAGFTGTFQAGYGQNVGILLPSGFESSFSTYQRVNGAVKNTKTLNGFFDLAYTFGPVTPHFYFGFDNAKNDDYYKVGDDNNTRTMVGGSINYVIAGPFSIIPEFTYYDYGKTPGVASKPDIGKEWIGGVQFRFTF